MSKQAFDEYIKPFLVLVVICLAVSFLLAFTNSVTEPIITENKRLEAIRTRQAVLPGSVDFEEIDCDTAALDIDGAYRETAGAGFVITSTHVGYGGGEVIVTVGLDNDGRVVGISVDVSSQTSGIGSKAGERSYLDNFMGLAGSADGVDTIANATRSSTAVKQSVNAALNAFDTIKGAN